MPAKSSAYEKGIREGKAMAARARNMEAPEPEEEEEGEEEEMDMAANHSRKRSAKGAKHTKPAADSYGKKPMDAECGCNGRKGGKCDGNCSSMPKRSDALTPLEYLDACELGIQGRSTAYIRARLDAAESRMDPRGTKAAAMEAELAKQAAARGLKGERAAAYIYGTLNKMGYKKGSKTTRKGTVKMKRSDSVYATGFELAAAALEL